MCVLGALCNLILWVVPLSSWPILGYAALLDRGTTGTICVFNCCLCLKDAILSISHILIWFIKVIILGDFHTDSEVTRERR